MTITTTLKLPVKLRQRIGPLARKAGQSPHAWMVQALEREAELAALRESFIEDALDSARDIDEGGVVFAAEDVHAYLKARLEGKPVRRPRPMKRTTTSRSRSR
jgi:predicted transcriptional regulator